MSEDDLFQVGLLRMVEQLHMSHTGSSDALSEEDESEYIAYLARRLASWRRADARSERYDNAVVMLISAAIAERGQ